MPPLPDGLTPAQLDELDARWRDAVAEQSAGMLGDLLDYLRRLQAEPVIIVPASSFRTRLVPITPVDWDGNTWPEPVQLLANAPDRRAATISVSYNPTAFAFVALGESLGVLTGGQPFAQMSTYQLANTMPPLRLECSGPLWARALPIGAPGAIALSVIEETDSAPSVTS